MPAIKLIEELKGEFRIIDHCIECIFGYAKKVKKATSDEDSFAQQLSSSEQASISVEDNSLEVSGLND